jgi:hypothetical protein
MRKWLLAAALFSSCALADPNPYERELETYANYLNQQYNAGRITKSQMDYMIGVKESEMQARAALTDQRERNTEFWRGVAANQRPPTPTCSPSPGGPWGQMDCR